MYNRPAQARGGGPQGRRPAAGLSAIRNRDIGFVLHDCPADASRAAPNWVRFAQLALAPQAPSPAALPRIGFVFPRPCACPIHHNSLPGKDLPFISLLCKVGLFRTFSPFGAPAVLRARPNWVCLARWPGPQLRSGPRPSSPKPRPTRRRRDWLRFARQARQIGFVLRDWPAGVGVAGRQELALFVHNDIPHRC